MECFDKDKIIKSQRSLSKSMLKDVSLLMRDTIIQCYSVKSWTYIQIVLSKIKKFSELDKLVLYQNIWVNVDSFCDHALRFAVA